MKRNLDFLKAVRANDFEKIKEILNSGVEFNFDEKEVALLTAISSNNIELSKMMIEKGADPNAVNINGYSALSLACCYKQAEIVSLLLEYGASVNIKINNLYNSNSVHMPLLCYTVMDDSIEIVKLLLDTCAYVNAVDESNNTPIIYACRNGNAEIAKLLLDSGANIHVITKEGNSCLLLACRKGNIEIVKSLLDLGANVNVVNKDGNTPLIAACMNGNLEIVKLLLDAGANVNVKNKMDLTPLNIARKANHNEIVKLLMAACAK